MGLQALFTCDVCKKQEIRANAKRVPWTRIPLKDKGWYSNQWGSEMDPYVHEWLCSKECMEKWVQLDPEHRAIYEEDEELARNDKYCPVHIIRRTKNHIWLCIYDVQFRLSDGAWVGGGYHGRCYGKLREEDRLRLQRK
jgi:hypothetical protein